MRRSSAHLLLVVVVADETDDRTECDVVGFDTCRHDHLPSRRDDKAEKPINPDSAKRMLDLLLEQLR